MPLPGIGKISGELITMPEEGKVTHQPTLMCCHCGNTWIAKKGSGKKRGLCLCCHGFTCGDPGCDNCVPFEQQLENVEAGRDIHYRPIRAVGGWDSGRVSEGGVFLGR